MKNDKKSLIDVGTSIQNLLQGPPMKIIYFNYHFVVYPEVCGFEYSLQIFDIICFESRGSHAISSELVLLRGGGEK